MILYLIVIILSLFAHSQSCTCKKPDVTESYCKADFVAHVHFLNIQSNLSDPFLPTEYKVEYVKIYRKSEKFDAVKNQDVIISPPQEACGVTVDMGTKNGKSWAIFGTLSKEEPFINICWPNAQWSKEMKDRLEKGDLANVDCSYVPPTTVPTTTSPPTTVASATNHPSVGRKVKKHKSTPKP